MMDGTDATIAADEMMSIAEIRESLVTNEKGQPLNTPGNYKLIFTEDPLLKGAFSQNLLTDRIDIVKDLGWRRDGEQVTDVDVQYLLLYLDRTYRLSSEKRIEGAIKVAANECSHHPIRDYLESLSWDGTERVRHAMNHFLGAEENAANHEMLRLFMLGAVTRVYCPGTKFEVMLCLIGGQGAGKSTFFRFLAVRDDWFSDDLKRLEDENVYRKLQGHWIIEMSEMIATVNAKSIEEIKSFLSRQKDTYKVPYATHPKDYRRQCVFAGTSNARDFLPLDRTGNRRFLPIPVNPEKAEVHILEDETSSRAYIDQMWAEIMEEYREGGFTLKLSRETEAYLKEHQREFMPEDTVAAQILNYLDRCGEDMVCSRMIFHEALGRAPLDVPKQYEIREINSIMNSYAKDWVRFEGPRHFREPYGRQKGWVRQRAAGNTENFVPVGDAEEGRLSVPEEWRES